VIRELADLTGNPELGLQEVGPRQFHGIEVKPWAREIAELTLWIGFHQFWKEHHKGVNPPEPVLEDTGTLEQRDAVLAWDAIVEVPEKSRPDPTPRIVHPVTGKMVPDPEARLPYFEYVGARQAEWPRADFIVGNPPYLGVRRQRDAFGDGYVDALRSVYPDFLDTADYVMYWWYRAARSVARGEAIRSGLITTNSLRQPLNRPAIEAAAIEGARIAWAVADHPWVEESDGAAVRVAMTVVEREPHEAALVFVDNTAAVVGERRAGRLNSDLSIDADVSSATAIPLLANRGLSSRGFTLVGRGFVLNADEAKNLRKFEELRPYVRPYLNGRDVASRPRGAFVIDFGLMSEDEARAFPHIFDLIRDRVKPQRDSNSRASYRSYWWRYGEPRPMLRKAIVGLNRFIATPYVSTHALFTFFDVDVAPDEKLVLVASADAAILGYLSSNIHRSWALTAGTRLGVGNDPTYNNSLCFDPFPFPDAPKHLRDRIAVLAETLDQHRKDALARDERVTMTGMYNVVEKLRASTPLTPKERTIHEIAACGVLRDLHETLDALVAEAYGWPWPMEREEILAHLVALHDERVEEEKRGHVRWLRPEYQVPRYGRADEPAAEELDLGEVKKVVKENYATATHPWPRTAALQLAALQRHVAERPATPAEAAAAHPGAREDLVRRHLETLALVGEVRHRDDGRYEAVTEPV
jgi:hypothetical protein